MFPAQSLCQAAAGLRGERTRRSSSSIRIGRSRRESRPHRMSHSASGLWSSAGASRFCSSSRAAMAPAMADGRTTGTTPSVPGGHDHGYAHSRTGGGRREHSQCLESLFCAFGETFATASGRSLVRRKSEQDGAAVVAPSRNECARLC